MNYKQEKKYEAFLDELASGYDITDDVKEQLKFVIARHVDALVEKLFMEYKATMKFEVGKDKELTAISKVISL